MGVTYYVTPTCNYISVVKVSSLTEIVSKLTEMGPTHTLVEQSVWAHWGGVGGGDNHSHTPR